MALKEPLSTRVVQEECERWPHGSALRFRSWSVQHFLTSEVTHPPATSAAVFRDQLKSGEAWGSPIMPRVSDDLPAIRSACPSLSLGLVVPRRTCAMVYAHMLSFPQDRYTCSSPVQAAGGTVATAF